MTTDQKKVLLKRDPRFVRPKKKQTKLAVDSRFKEMFVSEEFQAPVKVDKYGRKIVDKAAGEDLKRFYRLESEEEDEKSKEEEQSNAKSDFEHSSESHSSSDSSSAEDDDQEPEMLVFEETLAQHPLVITSVELGEATRRLAVVNLDWDQIKAVDILHMAQAFKPVTGVIESVKIYPSEFGKERMAKEAIEGPPKDIFIPEGDKDASGSDSESDGEEPVQPLKPVMVDEGEDFNESELRKYQLDRLRYFYAVITCDSVQTAAAIYKQCDGAEFEMSANFLDMRYIPDSVTFDDDEPTDVADHLTKSYKPKTDIITPALQHSKVKLTWDMDDPDRARMTKVNFANFDVNENDLKAYLASSSEEESEEERPDAERYRQLLLSGGDNVFGRKSHEDNQDLRITFTSGFGNLDSGNDDDDIHMEATFNISDDEEEKEDQETGQKPGETVFEARLRRMREKKKQKKEARLSKIEETKAAEKELRAEQKRLQKKRRRTDGDDSTNKEAAELDLLMLEDTHDAMEDRHFDMNEIVKAERKRGKKGKAAAASKKVEDDFELDVKDDRFKAVFDEPAYSIDPTHAAYKPTKAMRRLIDERQRRNKSRD